MAEISDTELLMDLIQNDPCKTQGLKAVDAWDPSTGTVFQHHVANCEPSHTVGEDEDTKISCPGCGELCHMHIPMGCRCKDKPKEPYVEPEHEWDIL